MSDPKREMSKREVYDTPRAASTRNGDVRVVGARACHTVHVDDCNADEVLHFICMVADNGDLCSFCKTSDGGAICITVLCGQRKLKSYARGADELVVRLNDLLEVLYA